jgi:hypothetical protein
MQSRGGGEAIIDSKVGYHTIHDVINVMLISGYVCKFPSNDDVLVLVFVVSEDVGGEPVEVFLNCLEIVFWEVDPLMPQRSRNRAFSGRRLICESHL